MGTPSSKRIKRTWREFKHTFDFDKCTRWRSPDYACLFEAIGLAVKPDGSMEYRIACNGWEMGRAPSKKRLELRAET